MDVEKEQLETELGARLEELEAMKKRHLEEEAALQAHISDLSEKLDNIVSSIPVITASVFNQRLV